MSFATIELMAVSRPASESWFMNRRAWSPDRFRSGWSHPDLADETVGGTASTPTTGGTSSRWDGDAASVEEAAAIEVSVVMPCLNESDTLATCIRKARVAMEAAGLVGEVIVAD